MILASNPVTRHGAQTKGLASPRQGHPEGRAKAARYQLPRSCRKATSYWREGQRAEYLEQDRTRELHGYFLRAMHEGDWLSYNSPRRIVNYGSPK